MIADERAPAGLLFGATGEGRRVGRGTRRIAIVAVQVNGVPQIAVDEALWMRRARALEASVESATPSSRRFNRREVSVHYVMLRSRDRTW